MVPLAGTADRIVLADDADDWLARCYSPESPTEERILQRTRDSWELQESLIGGRGEEDSSEDTLSPHLPNDPSCLDSGAFDAVIRGARTVGIDEVVH